jgi:hypothetical protein
MRALREGKAHRLAAATLALLCGLAGAAACDPVHQDAVDALGPEAPGVRRGPLHRPGQPCLLCHDGTVGAPQAFSVAGTIFERPTSTTPVENANVHVVDADGKAFDATTNAAGNFYVLPSQFTPRYPMRVSITTPVAVQMQTLTEMEGSCAGCHVDPAGPTSPGHVSLVLDDGGVPP